MGRVAAVDICTIYAESVGGFGQAKLAGQTWQEVTVDRREQRVEEARERLLLDLAVFSKSTDIRAHIQELREMDEETAAAGS